MLNTWLLCTGAELDFGAGVWGEAEKIFLFFFFCFARERRTQGAHGSKTVFQPRRIQRGVNGSSVELLTRNRVCTGPALL